MLIVFIIAALGYLIGSVKIYGLKLGSSGVLLVALIFGHFGLEVPTVLRDIGLICFVTAVGYIAGPIFFRNFKSKALSYVSLGILIIFTGVAVCIMMIQLFQIPTPLAVGMLSGALTSTPGLAAALEATSDPLASVGYGIAYPFGVVGVVLLVQLIPKLLKANMEDEIQKLNIDVPNININTKSSFITLEDFGFLPFSIAVVIGLLLAKAVIPLPGGASFSLGVSGGPLLIGLIMGHFGHIAKYSISVPKKTLETMREFGLILFLMGAGTNAGNGFVAVLQQYGVKLFLLGALLTVIPMLVGLFVAIRIFKLELLNALGSICGGMTSTPALGTLISVAKTDAVAAAYAATYPVALILIVLASQFISILF